MQMAGEPPAQGEAPQYGAPPQQPMVNLRVFT